MSNIALWNRTLTVSCLITLALTSVNERSQLVKLITTLLTRVLKDAMTSYHVRKNSFRITRWQEKPPCWNISLGREKTRKKEPSSWVVYQDIFSVRSYRSLLCLMCDTDRKIYPESEDRISSESAVHKILIKTCIVIHLEAKINKL